MTITDDDYLYYHRATVTSTQVKVEGVLDLPPKLQDGTLGLRARASQGEWIRGGNPTTLPHPVALSSGSGELTQVGVYGSPNKGATDLPFSSTVGGVPYQGVVSVSRGYILILNGGGWTNSNPDAENPTMVTVFHWTPDNDLAPGDTSERGYFS